MNKAIYNPTGINKDKYIEVLSDRFTVGKIYDVVDHIPGSEQDFESIYIIDDNGEKIYISISYPGSILFEDGYIIYRNKLIDGILK